MIKTANFAFLAVHVSNLPKLGGLAERYFGEDPPTCLIKLRQFAELVAKLVAARTATYAGERETFEETLRRLSYERLVPREVGDLFHRARSLGNAAAHENRVGHSEGWAANSPSRSSARHGQRRRARRELPQAGEKWPEPKRKLWLDTAASIFKIIYADDEAAH
jgi:type I restriction enzyme R subunit